MKPIEPEEVTGQVLAQRENIRWEVKQEELDASKRNFDQVFKEIVKKNTEKQGLTEDQKAERKRAKKSKKKAEEELKQLQDLFVYLLLLLLFLKNLFSISFSLMLTTTTTTTSFAGLMQQSQTS